MLGIVFPGQGSQSLGMLADIATQFPEVQQTYQEASAVLNYDLWDLVQQGPVEKLDMTVHTQPALLAASVAIWRIMRRAPNWITPHLLAGHSLGEYSALVCAEAISFTDGIKIVAARGLYMQEAAPTGLGSMAAIVGLEDSVVTDICKQATLAAEIVMPANLNCPGQIVIAGHTPAVMRAIEQAKLHGARLAKALAVSAPSHCVLMQPAAERLTTLLNTIEIKTPIIPVINNAYVQAYQSPTDIRKGLIQQLILPVRWLETIQYFMRAGITTVIECGPGKVLMGLNKRTGPSLTLINTADLISLQQHLASII